MLRILLLLPLLMLAACDSTPAFDPGPDVETLPVSAEDVADARATWAASGAEDYAMTLRRSCFCDTAALGPFRVRVENDAIVSVFRGSERVDADRARTVTDLFDLLDSALDGDAASVRAAFDPDSGAPVGISIDYDVLIADEEIGYTVWNVVLG